MYPSLLQPPSHLSPSEALQLSQQAATVLQKAPSPISSSPLSALLSGPENPEVWVKLEHLVLCCLRTEDDESAHRCLERLVARFGSSNENVMALEGLVKEAAAKNPSELEVVLKEYDDILSESNTNIPVTKRRIALLRSLGRVSDTAAALIQLLDFSPTDAEAWAELSDVYFSQGMYPQAIYAMEEVLILAPNAWNIHARLGEMQYMAATASGANEGSFRKYIPEALKRFARSVELCDDYLRGFYGLKLVTSKLLQGYAALDKQGDTSDFPLPDKATVECLDELATGKLAEIVRRYGAQEKRWQGYDKAEIAAARELLGQKD